VVWLHRQLAAKAFKVNHTLPSLGYTLFDVRKKLKAEFQGKPGPELARLRREGVAFEDEHWLPRLTYIGDSTIDTLYRDFEYTARQAMQRWGDANPDAISKAAEKEPERKFRFVHAVEPRGEREPNRLDGGHKTYASIYVAEEGRTILQESGFDEFPYMVSRYVTAPREVWAKRIVTAPEDTMTRATKEQIVAHNRKVAVFCR